MSGVWHLSEAECHAFSLIPVWSGRGFHRQDQRATANRWAALIVRAILRRTDFGIDLPMFCQVLSKLELYKLEREFELLCRHSESQETTVHVVDVK